MSLPAGTRVGRYEMHSLLGEGGMGQVYLAQDTQLDRPIALKILPPAVAADPQRLNRFLQEARAASKISGAHAAHIYEIGEASGVHFIAMEYVEGEQLAQRLAARRHTPAEIAHIGAQIGEALEEAHARGVTHRDIKPQNVVVTPRGQAKVLDFGLAKLTDEVPSEAATRVRTNPGTVMGTVSYMSPEQALGREDVDSRTDIFSLGIVLYEMATGQLPFEGGSVTETIDRIVHAQPEAIARFNYEVPAELEGIIRKALRKNRDERYQTARDMGTDLRSLARELGSGEHGTPSLPAQRTETPAMRQSASSAEYIVEGIRRHKTGALAALALVLLAGTAYVVYRYAFRAAPARFEQVKLTRITTEGNLQSVVVSPDGKYIAYALLEAGKRSLWTKHLATDSRVQIVASTEANELDPHFFSHDGGYVFFEQRDEQNRLGALFQVAVLGGPPKKILTDLASPAGLSPDGRRIAFARYRPGAASEQYQVWLADADGSNERQLWACTEPQHLYLNGLSWSPDGKLLAVDYGNGEDDATMATIAVADGTFKVITPQRWDRVGRIAWFGDGSGMAVAARERGQSWQIWRVAYPKGEARRITNDLHSYGFHSLTLTADSRTLVALQAEGTASMWIAPQGDARRARDLNVRGGANGLDWTPDGRLVVTSNAGGRQGIWMMHADGGVRKPLTQGGASPQVSADGRYIYYKRRSKTQQVWRVDSDGSHPKQLTEGDGVEAFALTPDGRWVIYSLHAPNIWKIPTDGGTPTKVADASAFAVQVSPDGRLFAHAGLDAQANRLQLAVRAVDGGTLVRRSISR
ncbi:MAG TPA: protein kinase [Vicinamibacterales bacterium]|nr:protein kinase [Vicinamibacterales bacterium]